MTERERIARALERVDASMGMRDRYVTREELDKHRATVREATALLRAEPVGEPVAVAWITPKNLAALQGGEWAQVSPFMPYVEDGEAMALYATPVPPDAEFPTMASFYGAAPDITGGLSSTEFVRARRDAGDVEALVERIQDELERAYLAGADMPGSEPPRSFAAVSHFRERILALARQGGEREPNYCGRAFGLGGGLGDPVYICDRPRGHAGRHFGHPVESGEVLVSLTASPPEASEEPTVDFDLDLVWKLDGTLAWEDETSRPVPPVEPHEDVEREWEFRRPRGWTEAVPGEPERPNEETVEANIRCALVSLQEYDIGADEIADEVMHHLWQALAAMGAHDAHAHLAAERPEPHEDVEALARVLLEQECFGPFHGHKFVDVRDRVDARRAAAIGLAAALRSRTVGEPLCAACCTEDATQVRCADCGEPLGSVYREPVEQEPDEFAERFLAKHKDSIRRTCEKLVRRDAEQDVGALDQMVRDFHAEAITHAMQPLKPHDVQFWAAEWPRAIRAGLLAALRSHPEVKR